MEDNGISDWKIVILGMMRSDKTRGVFRTELTGLTDAGTRKRVRQKLTGE